MLLYGLFTLLYYICFQSASEFSSQISPLNTDLSPFYHLLHTSVVVHLHQEWNYQKQDLTNPSLIPSSHQRLPCLPTPSHRPLPTFLPTLLFLLSLLSLPSRSSFPSPPLPFSPFSSPTSSPPFPFFPSPLSSLPYSSLTDFQNFHFSFLASQHFLSHQVFPLALFFNWFFPSVLKANLFG